MYENLCIGLNIFSFNFGKENEEDNLEFGIEKSIDLEESSNLS